MTVNNKHFQATHPQVPVVHHQDKTRTVTTEPYLLQETQGRVAILTMNRPATYHAWRDADRATLVDALHACTQNPDIAAIVITGQGDKAFCAGQDLSEGYDLTQQSRDQALAFWARFRDFYDTVRKTEKPIISAVNGVAAGSGFQFTMLTDMVIAHAGVRMGQPEVNSGLASITGVYFMRQSLGKSRAMELALSGRLMDAEELCRLGLVHRLVDQDQVLPQAISVANAWAEKSASAIALTKRAFWQNTQDEFDRIWELAIRYQSDILQDHTTEAAMSQFLK